MVNVYKEQVTTSRHKIHLKTSFSSQCKTKCRLLLKMLIFVLIIYSHLYCSILPLQCFLACVLDNVRECYVHIQAVNISSIVYRLMDQLYRLITNPQWTPPETFLRGPGLPGEKLPSTSSPAATTKGNTSAVTTEGVWYKSKYPPVAPAVNSLSKCYIGCGYSLMGNAGQVRRC